MNIYYRNRDGSLGKAEASFEGEDNHEECILMVKEHLVSEGIGYSLPVLAIIKGEKQ